MAREKRAFKISKEQAEEWFSDWLVDMDLTYDTEDDEGGTTKARIIAAIMYGDLEFNENGEAVYTPMRPNSKYKDPITFYERTGEVILASDGKGKNALARQTFAMMGKLCKVEPRIFAQMAGTDIKTCEALFTLLMA